MATKLLRHDPIDIVGKVQMVGVHCDHMLLGYYCATKWAVEALHEALAQEVKAFGIKVTLVEPGAYATDFGKSAQVADALEPYAEFRKQFLTHLSTRLPKRLPAVK